MNSNLSVLFWVSLTTVILTVLVLFALFTDDPQVSPVEAAYIPERSVPDGDVETGRQLLIEYGCGSCHSIPGIPQANALVGPPLDDWSQRRYIAGSLPNTLENLMGWLINPQAIEPGTAMPNLGVNQAEARHMSAYLYTLGD
ncbi:MAG: hypothetical protein OHK0046_18590 [Anaerolineae bacterium]